MRFQVFLLGVLAAAATAGSAPAATVISHDFDSTGIGGYTVTSGNVFGDPLDTASFPAGDVLYLHDAAQRSVTFDPVDLSSGGTISFDLVLGSYNLFLGYFEGQDGGQEDVSFSYSTDGTTWIDFDRVSTTAQNTGTVNADGWNARSYTLAGGSAFATTSLRFLQPVNSGASYDHWAIDNVIVTNGVSAGVPEPSTWAMLLLGFGLVGTACRGRRRAAGGDIGRDGTKYLMNGPFPRRSAMPR